MLSGNNRTYGCRIYPANIHRSVRRGYARFLLMTHLTDVLIIGGGIAGAGAAYEIAAFASVTVLEREPQCGYHSTGRSAASFTENYGNAVVRRLAMASRAFLETPPAGFCDHVLLSPRGLITIAQADQSDLLEQQLAVASALVPSIVKLDAAAAIARVPILRPEYVAAAIIEPHSKELDVSGFSIPIDPDQPFVSRGFDGGGGGAMDQPDQFFSGAAAALHADGGTFRGRRGLDRCQPARFPAGYGAGAQRDSDVLVLGHADLHRGSEVSAAGEVSAARQSAVLRGAVLSRHSAAFHDAALGRPSGVGGVWNRGVCGGRSLFPLYEARFRRRALTGREAAT